MESPTSGPLTEQELQLATRNRGMPLEALRYDITPTGLHYLLVHYDIPLLDADSWRLRVDGRVGRPTEIALSDLKALPKRSVPVTLECAGNGRARLHPRPLSQPWLLEAIGTAEWAGASVPDLLDELELADDCVELVFHGADHGVEKGREQDYARSLPLTEARRPEVLLAYEMNGEPLPPQHGFPLRLIVPGWYGMTSVKWLSRIEAVARPFEGYQQAVAYRYQREKGQRGDPVDRIRPRALMVPPGFPDFFTRHRTLDAGTTTLEGRAWSGRGEVMRVEVSIDGKWRDAELGSSLGRYAWRRFALDWDAPPGEHVLSCRATDRTGAVQPTQPHWNVQGMGNNEVQTISVTVRDLG